MTRAAIAVVVAALAAASVSPAGAGQAQTAEQKAEGSLYLQCDGKPNNVTAGETAARLLGAVTLLALFAPEQEGADASKRKFGADGVAACTAILEGEKAEGNPGRRVELLLGRALHRIEAKDYQAAIADVALARGEAEAAGLTADPYFARSRGRGFDLVESAALFRLGKAAEARETALRGAGATRYGVFAMLSTPDYGFAVRDASAAEDQALAWATRNYPQHAMTQASRLEELGRFVEAAAVRDALVDYDDATTRELRQSTWLAQAAVAQALAGNREAAAERAARARANFEARRAAGKPDGNAAEYVELMDLYAIIDAASGGELKAARRLFAARSQWVAASFGSVLAVNRRLREGAAADELIGGLARDADQLWKEREDARRAEALARDADNRSLFRLIPPFVTAAAYEAQSKTVWRTDKSRLLLPNKPAKDGKESKAKAELLFLYGVDPRVAGEAYLLHAALLAKSRGQPGFALQPILSERIFAGRIVIGKRGEPGLSDAVFHDAEDVIRELSPIIPDPETLKLRQARKRSS